MCMKHHLGSQGPSNTISNTSLTEPVTSGLPTMLRMRNLGSADKVTGSVREFLLETVTSGLPTMLRMRNLGIRTK
jgi:hypothetical protein